MVCAVERLTHADGPEATHIPVKAIRVGKSDQNTITGMGSLRCRSAVDLGFDVPGVIAQIFVKEGDKVSEGQALVKLDQRLVEAELAIEQAGVKAAGAEFEFQNAELEKKKGLFEKYAISESEFLKARFERERALASIESARKKVDSAQTKKDKMVLLAPSSGEISKLYLQAGEVTNYSAYKVLRVIDCREVDAEIELGEKIYSAVGKGQEISLLVDALPNRKFSGVIYHMSPEINPKTRTFTARARVANPDMLLRPGMFARAEIDISRISGPLLITEKSLINYPGGGEGVFIIKDGAAIRRRVKVGLRDLGKVQVTSGLNNGDIVVVEGNDRLSDLSKVSVTMVEEE
jgi:membrane fusion protein (multidrug efflux system)